MAKDVKVITPKSIFEMNNDDINSKIEMDFRQSKEDLSKKSQNYKDYWDRYIGRPKSRSQEETGEALAKISFPKSGGIVDWSTARMKETIFNNRPIVNITGASTNYDESARVAEELIDKQLFHVPEVRRKYGDLIKGASIYNTGIIKVYWDFDKKQATFDTISRLNYFHDPYARYIGESAFGIHRYYKTKEALWAQRMENGKGMYETSILQKYFNKAQTIQEEESASEMQKESTGDSTQPSEEGRYEILEYWTPGKTTGMITVGLWNFRDKNGNDKSGMVQLRKEEKFFDHGKLPFLGYIVNPIPDQFDGHGIIAMLIELQNEYDTLRRLAMDHTNFVVNPEYTYPEKMFSPSQKAILNNPVPGQWIPHKDGYSGQAEPVKRDNLPQEVWQHLALYNDDMQKRVGVYEHMQGQMPARRETATTTISILSRGDMMNSNNFGDFAEMILKPQGIMFLELNQQFLEGKIMSSILSEDGKTQPLPVDIIKGDFDYEVNVSAIRGSNEMQRAQLMQVFEMLAKNPQLAQMMGLNLQKLFKDILITFDQIKNPEKLFEGQEMGLSPQGVGQPPSMGMLPPISEAGMFRGVPSVPFGGGETPSKMGRFA